MRRGKGREGAPLPRGLAAGRLNPAAVIRTLRAVVAPDRQKMNDVGRVLFRVRQTPSPSNSLPMLLGSVNQSQVLVESLRSNGTLWEALSCLSALQLPDWYVGAGCVAQTVWDLTCGKPAHGGIRDYDLVYFDPDLSEAAEQGVRERATALLADLGVVVDVANQARVHLWYRERFGYDIRPYTSLHDAISTWPTTASAVAVRPENGTLLIHAPFGLDDLFDLVVRANRVQITHRLYEEKTSRWLLHWPTLRVLPWDQGIGVEGSRVIHSVW